MEEMSLHGWDEKSVEENELSLSLFALKSTFSPTIKPKFHYFLGHCSSTLHQVYGNKHRAKYMSYSLVT